MSYSCIHFIVIEIGWVRLDHQVKVTIALIEVGCTPGKPQARQDAFNACVGFRLALKLRERFSRAADLFSRNGLLHILKCPT